MHRSVGTASCAASPLSGDPPPSLLPLPTPTLPLPYPRRWVDILRCISRWELLQQIASGMPTDAVLFSPPERGGGMKAVIEKARRLIRESDLEHRQSQQQGGGGGSGGGVSGSGASSIDAMGMSEASIKKAHIGGAGVWEGGGR